MTDRQRDERPWKRICLDHTLSSEVFSSQPEHYKAVKTTAEPCSQEVHISDDVMEVRTKSWSGYTPAHPFFISTR